MSTLSLPAWFDVLECEGPVLVPDTRGFQGPFGGPTEVQDLIGDRWRMRLTMPDGDFNWGGRTGALFNRLRGGANWLRMHDFARPVPRGTARGAMVLASSAAQGASSVVVSGVISTTNLLRNGSFEVDTIADGLADGWMLFVGGAGDGARTHALIREPSVPAVHGTASQRIQITAGGNASDSGILAVPRLLLVPGQVYTLSAHVRTGVSGKAVLVARVYNSGGSSLGEFVSAAIPATGVRELAKVTFTAPAGAVDADIMLRGITAVGEYIDADAVQIEPGSLVTPYTGPGTLLAGDKLGHNGEQLLEVAEDATATDAGVITVTLTNRLRKAIASGQTIVWDKPQIPWQLVDNRGVPTTYTRGRARGQQVEFVEAWQ